MNAKETNNFSLAGKTTQRISFVEVNTNHFEEWKKLFISDDVAKFLGLDPQLTPHELTTIWFDKTFDRRNNYLGTMNALIDKKNGKLIGQSGLLIQTIEDEQRLEVSYSILPEYWRQGFAYEAANACKNHAFKKEWSDNLISLVEPENIGSEKVALKNGMTLEKTIIELHNAPFNVFSIQKKNWLKTISNE